MLIKFIIISALLNLTLSALGASENFTGSKDSINIAGIVEEQIKFAKENPGRTSFSADLIKEANFSEEFFAFILRQYNSLTSISAESKIKTLAAVMFILGITLLMLILKLFKMKKETAFINNIKTIKESLSAGDSGSVTLDPNNIRKLLCADPFCLIDGITKKPGNNISKAAKNLSIAKGEFQLASKIRSYQLEQIVSSKKCFDFQNKAEEF